jgi:hypothetical protein
MTRPHRPAASDAPLPPARLMKLQILAGVFVPMALLGLWLHRQGFW